MDHPPSNTLLERAPELAGRYVIARELGRGTMGVVYEAEDVLLGRTVAVKTIELAFAIGPHERQDFEERFFNEARVAARLSHPGIVVCHDVGKDTATGKLFIVFERLKGQTLAERIAARQPMPWRETLPIVAELARAIHHAHAHGIVHRDLKPANVFLLEAGSGPAVKILDFGVARVESMRMRLTASGQSFGSPLYMSPEQALGQPTDARADIFSLGSILCTLLLGRPWFDAPSIPEIFARLLSDEAPRISDLVPNTPEALDTVVQRALAKQPADRYPSALAVAEDLEDVMAGLAPHHADALGANLNDGTLPGSLDLDSFLADLGGGGHLLRTADAGERTGTVDVLACLLDAPPPDTNTLPPPPIAAAPTPRIRLWVAADMAVLVVALVAAATVRGQRVGPVPMSTPPAAAAASAPAPQAASFAIPFLLTAPTPAPTPRSWVMLDVKHALREGHLRVWVDGALTIDSALHAPVTKRIVAIAIREGRIAKPVKIEPGRRELKVQVGWDKERRVATTAFEARPDATRVLEIRLGRMSKDLTLAWR